MSDYIYLSLEFFIFSLKMSYSLSTLFTDTNSSWLIAESIKALEIETSMVLNYSFIWYLTVEAKISKCLA